MRAVATRWLHRRFETIVDNTLSHRFVHLPTDAITFWAVGNSVIVPAAVLAQGTNSFLCNQVTIH